MSFADPSKPNHFVIKKEINVARLPGAVKFPAGLWQSVNCPTLQLCFVTKEPEGGKQRHPSLAKSAGCTLLQAEGFVCETPCLRLIKSLCLTDK